jgi:DNA-binding response OmpR family regulator
MTRGLPVLVVDDNEDVSASLAAWLRFEGHDARIALDGRQALVIAREFAPACVLLDISMPGMDGREVARELRAAYGTELVLIAITGWQDAALRTTGVFADFDHYLRKPIDLDLLARILTPG